MRPTDPLVLCPARRYRIEYSLIGLVQIESGLASGTRDGLAAVIGVPESKEQACGRP